MGAIKKQFFFFPLLQDTSLNAAQGIAAGGSRYALFGLPDIEAFQLPIAVTAARNIFVETASAWEDRRSELRNWIRRGSLRNAYASANADLPGEPPLIDNGNAGSSVWLKGIGSFTSRSASQDLVALLPAAGVLGSFDLGHRQNVYALLGGIDGGIEQVFDPSDALVFGLMGGYVNSNVNFKASPTSFRYNGGTAGASASFMAKGFYIDALFKADMLSLNMEFPSLAPFGIASLQPKVFNWGGIGNVGFRTDGAPWFVEPMVSVVYVRTKVDSFSVPGMTAAFADGESLRAGVGVRTGMIWASTAGYEVDTALTAKAWDEFKTTERVTLVTAGPDLTLSDKFTKLFGEVTSQLNLTSKSAGWSAFVSSGTKFNQEFATVNGKGGMRYQF